MISLTQSMNALDEAEGKFRATARAWSMVVRAVAQAIELLAGTAGQAIKARLEAMIQAVESATAGKAIEESGLKITEELESFSRTFAKSLADKEHEYKELIRLLAEAATSLSRSGADNSEDLTRVTKKIEAAAKLTTIAEVRSELSRRVIELHQMAERVRQEGDRRAAELQQELRTISDRLEAAQQNAETDALTGLGNRRLAEKVIRKAIDTNSPLSLILLDLDRFKWVNDTYGHQRGDQLLVATARGLRNSVRTGDLVCRWGGDEFMVILPNCVSGEAGKLADRIKARAFGEFVLEHQGRHIKVNVSASCGVAEHRAGETAGQLFEKADHLLYEQKANRRPQPAKV